MKPKLMYVQAYTGLTGASHRSNRCSPANNTSNSLSLSPRQNCPHTRLGPGHLHTRLKYTIEKVVLILVSPLLHSLLSLLLEAKFILMAISPTIATMEPHKLRFRLGMEILTWFLSTRLLNRFLLTSLLALFPKETFPEVLTKFIGFWKSFVCGGNTGGAGVVSSQFLRWLGLGGKSFLW
jgi:hypothetical protein